MKTAVIIYADRNTMYFDSVKAAAIALKCSRNQLDSALKSDSGLVYIRKNKSYVYIDYALPLKSDLDEA